MIELPSLPWGESALAPHISAETISFHYGKHHKAYVDNTNKMIEGTDLAGASLEDIVKAAVGKPDKKGLFNNSAQVWNHSFYWKSLSPKGGGQPTGKLLDRIKSDFGDFAKFKDDLAKAAVTQFGSGWAWLVLEGGKLKSFPFAASPLAHPAQPVDGERVIALGLGVVQETAQHLVVAGGAHPQVLAHGPVLGPGVEPPGTLEVEHGAFTLTQHRPQAIACRAATRGFRPAVAPAAPVPVPWAPRPG